MWPAAPACFGSTTSPRPATRLVARSVLARGIVAEARGGMSGAERVTIEVRGLETFGPHGVTEEERVAGCRIVLDIALDVEAAATASDEIAGTVDYGALTRRGERSWPTAASIRSSASAPSSPTRSRPSLPDRVEDQGGEAGAADERPPHRCRGDAAPGLAVSDGAGERVAYLGLGSNVGDRWASLRGAIAALRRHGVSVDAVLGV